MKCMIVVLAVASFCLAEPEADPLHYYAPYGYAAHTPGGYQAVHRLHKREAEAEADPQLLLAAGAAPYVNDGPVAGPLTPVFGGDAVQTPRGLASIALEGFSEDVNQDGFVDPIAPAVPAPVVHPIPAALPFNTIPAALPFNTIPAPVAAPLSAIPAPVLVNNTPFPNHAGAVNIGPTQIRNGHPIT